MLYVIQGTDREESIEARRGSREAHVARIRALQEEGRLVLAGPLPAIDAADPGPAGHTGSLIVAEFESLDSAKAWAGADPYIDAGAWVSVDVHPFVQVAP